MGGSVTFLLIDIGAGKHRRGTQLYERHQRSKRTTVWRSWRALARLPSTLRSEALRSKSSAGSHDCMQLSQSMLGAPSFAPREYEAGEGFLAREGEEKLLDRKPPARPTLRIASADGWCGRVQRVGTLPSLRGVRGRALVAPPPSPRCRCGGGGVRAQSVGEGKGAEGWQQPADWGSCLEPSTG